MFLLRAAPADLLHCRFALSPLWELLGAVRATHRQAEQRWHLPWLTELAGAELPAGLSLLQAMQPAAGYTPDFLAPTPTAAGTALVDEIERVAQTPLDTLAAELVRCRAGQPEPAVSAVLDELIADPALARDRIVAALHGCWEALLAAHWRRVGHLLDADIAYHARQLADHGLIALLDHLHPDVRWRAPTVQVRWQHPAVEQERDLAGAGLVLMPSAFTWPHVLAVLDPPWQPTIVYPARGVGALWQQQPAAANALRGVLGGTRARLLTDLAEPASTTWLAQRYDLAPSTLSRHLRLLLSAGLVQLRRDRRQVLYQRTALGTALCEAGVSRASTEGPVRVVSRRHR